MRSRLFNLFFYGATLLWAVALTALLLIPGRRALAAGFRAWGRTVMWGMRRIAHIEVEIRGREHIPAAGPALFASKHQSEVDGMVMAAILPDVSFVAMREVWEYPLVGRILRRLEMIRVDTCGGDKERRNLAKYAARAHRARRNIVIYPEGHLMNVGEKERYRTGIFYLYRDLGLPVVPVAHALGLRWPTREAVKHPGRTILSFLAPIPTGLDRSAFMARLESAIEDETAELVAELTGQPVIPARLKIKHPEQYPHLPAAAPRGDRLAP